jgi:hypothetical protein
VVVGVTENKKKNSATALTHPLPFSLPSSSGACELTLDTPECGFDAPAAVEPLTFTVKDDVPVSCVWGKKKTGG